MPTVTRTRTIAAAPERIWTEIADPERLVAWWPRAQRVEEATGKAWTLVLGSGKGDRALRADFTLLASDHPRASSWRHEVDESPFARVLSSSETDIRLEPKGDGTTRVSISERIALRGISRLGGWQMRRAIKRKLDAALEGLDRLLGGVEAA